MPGSGSLNQALVEWNRMVPEPNVPSRPCGSIDHMGVATARITALCVLMLLVATAAPASDAESTTALVRQSVELGTPSVAEVSWTEVVVNVPVRIRPVGVSGEIHGIGFSDMRINGIPFEVDPYTADFELPDDNVKTLDEPLRLRVRFSRVAPGVFDEAIMPSDVLQLTGQATVHGTFRKWIFSVKRSIDIPIDETRENPIAAYHPLKLALAEIRRLESMGFPLPFGAR